MLCVEGFSALLNEKVENGDLEGIQICRAAPKINHLFFADDCYLFFKATPNDTAATSAILYEYEACSGQSINLSKSEILFSPNVSDQDRFEICECLNIKEVDDSRSYLGLPAYIGANRRRPFARIKDKLWQKLNGWNRKNLS